MSKTEFSTECNGIVFFSYDIYHAMCKNFVANIYNNVAIIVIPSRVNQHSLEVVTRYIEVKQLMTNCEE